MSMVTIFSENKGSPFLKKWSVQMGIACWKEGALFGQHPKGQFVLLMEGGAERLLGSFVHFLARFGMSKTQKEKNRVRKKYPTVPV